MARTRAQGIGRQPLPELVATSKKLVDALDEELGAGRYFCGDRPTTYDATGYAFAPGVLFPAFDNELRKHAATKKNLVACADRMKGQFWKD